LAFVHVPRHRVGEHKVEQGEPCATYLFGSRDAGRRRRLPLPVVLGTLGRLIVLEVPRVARKPVAFLLGEGEPSDLGK
jgi:hypothetical protein